MAHLFPDRAPTFERVYTYFRRPEGGVGSSWPGMHNALVAARRDGYDIEYTADIVYPRMDPERWEHTWWWWEPETEYGRRLEGWLCAGWFAMTAISKDGDSMLTVDHKLNVIDHFVVLDGIEWRDYRPHVHIVCSVKGAYWMPVQSFLRLHGGSAWWLVRSADETDPPK